MWKIQRTHLLISIVKQGKNELEISKMPLRGVLYENERENVKPFCFFLCKDVFVMYFIIRISNSDKLTWIVSSILPCVMCFVHILAVGFSPTESSFTTGMLISTNKFLFQLQALWLKKTSPQFFYYPLKILHFHILYL